MKFGIATGLRDGAAAAAPGDKAVRALVARDGVYLSEVGAELHGTDQNAPASWCVRDACVSVRSFLSPSIHTHAHNLPALLSRPSSSSLRPPASSTRERQLTVVMMYKTIATPGQYRNQNGLMTYAPLASVYPVPHSIMA